MTSGPHSEPSPHTAPDALLENSKTHPAPRIDLKRLRLAREFLLALRRGLALGHCRSCETFYLMAKLCRDECSDALAPAECENLASWVEGGKLVELDFGCEGSCGIVAAYARLDK